MIELVRQARLSAFFLCSASLLASAQATAQQSPDDAANAVASTAAAGGSTEAEATEQIIVTGSRIRRSHIDSPAPIAVVNAEAIRSTGQTEIANVVNELPGLAITQTDQTSNLAGNAGINALDLRGLGTQRTLVLVDSRRRVASIPGTSAVDISTIPSSLVERVEIVTGGASALYGADAVAGVANFILKKDFEGIDAGGQYGASTRGDLGEYSVDILAGRNFHEGRGNVTVYGFYEKSPGTISGEDRPWTAGGYPIYSRASTSEPYTIQDGVRNVNNSRFAHVMLGQKLYTFTDEGALREPQLGPGGFVNRGRIDLSDPTAMGTLLTDGGEYGGRYDDYYLTVPSDRLSTRLAMNYEFDRALRLSVSGEYSRNKAEAAYAPLTAFGGDTIPVDSPFITDEMHAANGGAITAPLNFSRRFDELGTARTSHDRKLYQFVTSVEGDFSLLNHDWNYSAYYSFGKSHQKTRSLNSTAMGRFYDALDSTTDAAGNPICRSTLTDPDNGCVALNPFRPLTQEMIDYIQYDTSPAVSKLTQHVVSAYVGGGVFDLPGGTVQVVLGAEYRKERNDIGVSPELDPTSPRFDPTIDASATPLVGGYNVKEVFGEVHVPILSNVPFADTLSLDAAVRLSDYSTAGRTTTYKFGAEWAPIRDIRFRSTYGQAVRAPNIGELFTTSSVSGLWVTDPCNTWNLENRATRTEYTAANCALISPSDTDTYWVYRDIISKGNLDLGVETAKTLTIGAVIQPRFIPNLTLTIDYYNIDLRGAIAEFSAQTLIEKCVDSPTLDNPFCPLITRDADNNLESVVTQKMNLSRFLTRGIDFELNYQADLADWGLGDNSGSISIDAAYGRLMKRDFTLDPADQTNVTKSAGVFGSPKWKGVVRTTYSQDNFSITWAVRHFGPMKPTTTATAELYKPLKTPNVFYHDLSGRVNLSENVEVYGGLRNLFDKAPPRIPGAEAGGANFELGYQAGVYDSIGRTFFFGLRLTR